LSERGRAVDLKRGTMLIERTLRDKKVPAIAIRDNKFLAPPNETKVAAAPVFSEWITSGAACLDLCRNVNY
jgi:hypothetical protein